MENTLEVQPGLVLDLLEQSHPALSSTNDMPVVETNPDAQAPEAAPLEDSEAELSAETATVDTEEKPGVPAKPASRGVQKKLDELTKRAEDAKREAESEREEKRRLLALLEAKKEPTPQIEEEVPPQRTDFVTDEAWSNAVYERAQKVAIKAAETATNKRLQEQEDIRKQNQMRDAYLAREEKVREKYANFSEVAERPDVALPLPVIDAILSQDEGPELRYYFGDHPEEAKRFMGMTVNGQADVRRQLYELGKISQKLSEKPKPLISKAPAPVVPNKPGETIHSKPLDEMSMEEYIAARKKAK